MTASDTVAAISTPPGEGAIALVRISGANAIQTADKIFRGKEQPSKFASHVQHLGEIFSAENQLIDQVVLSVHRAPASYTGEDLVEISCHGGTLVSAKVLEACLRAGATSSASRRIHRARISQRQNGSHPGRGGDRFDSCPNRSGAAFGD